MSDQSVRAGLPRARPPRRPCSCTRRRQRAGSTPRSAGRDRCSSSSSTPPAPWSTSCSTAPSPQPRDRADHSARRRHPPAGGRPGERVLAILLARSGGRRAPRPRPAPFRPGRLRRAPPARRPADDDDARPPALRERLPVHAGGRRRRGRPNACDRDRRLARRRTSRPTRSGSSPPTPDPRPTRGTHMEHQIELGYLVLEVPDPTPSRRCSPMLSASCPANRRHRGPPPGATTDRANRLFVQSGPANDAVAIGVEAVDAAAFDAIVGRLQAIGCRCRRTVTAASGGCNGSPGPRHRGASTSRSSSRWPTRRPRSPRRWSRADSSPTASASGTRSSPRRRSRSPTRSSPTASGSPSPTGSRPSSRPASTSKCASTTATPGITRSRWPGRRSTFHSACTTSCSSSTSATTSVPPSIGRGRPTWPSPTGSAGTTTTACSASTCRRRPASRSRSATAPG